MKNKQRFTGLVGVYYYRRPNLIQRLLKAMKRALLSLSFIGCFTAAAQNIQILNTDDTVSINSTLNQYVYTLDFVNDTNITREIAVYEEPIISLPGTQDTVGFFAVWSPLSGEPEYLSVEAYGSASAVFKYWPNDQTGTHKVKVCFYDMNNPTDTTCTSLTIFADPFLTTNQNQTETMLTTYPNPTSSRSIITNANNQEFKLFDIYGNYLQGGIVASDSFELDLSEYPNGVYFANLVDQDHKLTVLKILKR